MLPRRWIQRALNFAHQHGRSLAVGGVLFLAGTVAFRVSRLAASYWTIDDAAITYAAAYELADHGSLATYQEGTPVESYSNPLLFFMVVLLRLLGIFDPVRTHVHLEMFVFGAMIPLVWSMLRTWTGEIAATSAAVMFGAVELVTPATWVWYGSGLENVWVSGGLVMMLWICTRAARGQTPTVLTGALAFLVAITRPEAPVYVAAFYAAVLVCARPHSVAFRTHLKHVARAAAVTLALYIVFVTWRRVAYGDWWPNTFYAKVTGDSSASEHFRDYVVGQLLRYAWSALFAFSVIGLLVTAQLEILSRCLLVFLVAALTLPITAGADWMGEHRFGTAFLVISHVTFAAFFATCIAQWRNRRQRASLVAAIVVSLALPGLLVYERVARGKIELNEVTVGHVARIQGGARWLHQMRLGLPYPVVMLPDAGGSLLVGGMQFVDTASLADFQLPRILRGDPSIAWRLINQYQNEEKRPDLVDFNRNSGVVDESYRGVRYLVNESHLGVRSDLVRVASVDPEAELLIDAPNLALYLSPDTVRRANPGALVRCELLVAWTGAPPDGRTRIRVSVAGDHDDISLVPYQSTSERAIERRGLLIAAPSVPGVYAVVVELEREGRTVARATMFQLRVSTDTRDIEQVAAQLTAAATPFQGAKRIAWLREQMLPRFTTQYFHVVLRALARGRMTSGDVGKNVMRLRWNARLAARETLPAAIRKAEIAAAANVLSTCSTGTTDDRSPARVLCIGRALDELRRLGYLDMLSRFPAVAAELHRARMNLQQRELATRYVILVGLTLADPSDVALQRALLEHRRAVAMAGAFPAL